MTNKPIFAATHPRACSTAFERVFMTCRDTLICAHEPFGDAFYYGPERLSERFEKDEKARIASGFQNSTYQTVLARLDKDASEGKRLFIKDIAHYLFPPQGKPASIAPSLKRIERGVGTGELNPNGNAQATNGHVTNGINGHGANGTSHEKDGINGDAQKTNGANGSSIHEPEVENPTVIPKDILKAFHFTFLIRHPAYAIPSYFRCTIPPLDDMTGFHDFDPAEAGYDELRRLFDYLKAIGQIGPHVAGESKSDGNTNGRNAGEVEICVIDADDLLDNPKGIIQAYCKSVGLEYNPDMLVWDTEEDNRQAHDAFEKWRGFHEDAMQSTYLKPRDHKKVVKSREQEDQEWAKKYGKQAAKVIRETVDANLADYEYLKQFALHP